VHPNDRRPVLLVDADQATRGSVAEALRSADLPVVEVSDGATGLQSAVGLVPSVVILEVELPGMSGLELCQSLRANPSTARVPLIFLSWRDDAADRVKGLEVGADDYMSKAELSLSELVLRVEVQLRRAPPPPAARDLREVGALCLDLDAHRASLAGCPLSLTPTEFRLLWALAEHPGRVYSRGALLEQVWGMAPNLNTRTVDTHVRRLREKLGEASEALQTVHGVGYLLTESS